MGADVHKLDQHQGLIDRLMLLAADLTLDEVVRELARAWRDRLDTARKRVDQPLSIAFIAQVGRGKSTLITVAAGLHLPISGNPQDWSVLPVGDGRTTLGETRVTFERRDDILLRVTPIPADELRIELGLFARDLYGEHSSASQAGEELYDLLRAWLVPADQNDEDSDHDPRQVLDKLARSVDDVGALEQACGMGRCIRFVPCPTATVTWSPW